MNRRNFLTKVAALISLGFFGVKAQGAKPKPVRVEYVYDVTSKWLDHCIGLFNGPSKKRADGFIVALPHILEFPFDITIEEVQIQNTRKDLGDGFASPPITDMRIVGTIPRDQFDALHKAWLELEANKIYLPKTQDVFLVIANFDI